MQKTHNDMKALSVRQPHAWLIVNGPKDIENRNWKTAFRGRVYIHAGLRQDYSAYEGDPVYRDLNPLIRGFISLEDSFNWSNEPLHLGAIIGEVDIVDCVTKSDSPWFEGPYGFVLANPVAYENPIPYKGQLGLFEVELERE